MKINDLLRKTHARRCGYMPHSISKTTLEPAGCMFLKRLRTIPNKITAYFHRDKIAEVWKTIHGGLDDAYYIIRATDGTLFHVDY